VAPRTAVRLTLRIYLLTGVAEVVVGINSHDHDSDRFRVTTADRWPDRYPLVSCCARVVYPATRYSGSRAAGHDMHRGPPRPVPNSDAAIVSTSIPASCSRALVRVLRS
jgi:hypothetical protein